MKKLVLIIILLSFSVVNAKEDNKEDLYFKDFLSYLELSGAKENQSLMLKNMFEQFKKMPDAKPENFDKAEKALISELDDLNKKLFPVYKKYLSHEDLKQIITFYETPVGKKLITAQPRILEDSFAIGVEWGKEIGNKLKKEITK